MKSVCVENRGKANLSDPSANRPEENTPEKFALENGEQFFEGKIFFQRGN